MQNGDDAPPYVSIADGNGGWIRFNSGRREVVEEKSYFDARYPSKIRITDSNEAGELDLVITRREVDSRSLSSKRHAMRMCFLTGYADLEGSTRVGDRTIAISGRGFGSSYEMRENWQ